MAGPSLTSASYAGPVALADELFDVNLRKSETSIGSMLTLAQAASPGYSKLLSMRRIESQSWRLPVRRNLSERHAAGWQSPLLLRLAAVQARMHSLVLRPSA